MNNEAGLTSANKTKVSLILVLVLALPFAVVISTGHEAHTLLRWLKSRKKFTAKHHGPKVTDMKKIQLLSLQMLFPDWTTVNSAMDLCK